MASRRDLANAIRALSMDAVQQANSGHPGAPMGMADIAEVLWNDYLSHNPADPSWANRDRFVLSNGHGSMLLYSLLHLSGYDLPIEEIKNFRQLHSKTPGHPEYGYAPGVETTTGPLGQGISNAVGMALAEKVLAGQFNRPGHEIVDHNTYTFLGDGCLMEGISHEVCSLAGTLKLGKLVAFYDDNGISIDGEVEGWFSDDTPARFESYGWQVIPNVDGHDSDAIKAAIEQACAETGKPTLICCKTIIGFGSPNKQGKEDCHGAALGVDEVALTREALGWTHGPFEIPDEHYAGWNGVAKGTAAQTTWASQLEEYRAEFPELAAEFDFTDDEITVPINPKKAWNHLGIITMIDKNIQTKKTIRDKEGRYIINIIQISEEKIIILANIYAPATYAENEKFYPKFTEKIKEIQNTYKEASTKIICGDYNGIIDHTLDKKIQKENQTLASITFQNYFRMYDELNCF